MALPAWHYDERGNFYKVLGQTSLLLVNSLDLRTVGKMQRGKDNYSFSGLIFTVE